MSTDNKTIREQAIEWWMNLDIVSIHELAIQYDCTYCTDDDKIRIYLSEHPQQTVKEDSVLSLEDAFENWLKDKDGEYRRMYGHHFRSFKGGADFKEQQYSELLSSYRELFEAIKLIEMKSWQKDEWEQMKIINNIAKSPLERATNILNNLK